MSAFVLFAHMQAGLAVTRAIHLDGLLLAARERAEGILDLERPLDCLAVDRGVYRASAGILLSQDVFGNAPMRMTRNWRFRTETREALAYFRLEDAEGRVVPKDQRSLPLSNSPYKPHFADKEVHSAVGAVGWQFVGDPHAVLRLARNIECLGPSSNHGFGKVARWSVEACDADPAGAGWYTGDRVIRNLPVELAPVGMRRGGPSFSVGRERIAPPYWDRDGRRACLVPIPRTLVTDYDTGQARLGLAA